MTRASTAKKPTLPRSLQVRAFHRNYHQLAQRLTDGLGPWVGSIPQLEVRTGVMRMYLPFPNIPSWSRTSALPLTLIPLGLHGSTDAMSSTTNDTRSFPAVMFMYLLVLGKISWLWLPTQKHLPSNSNPTGETSGTPFGDAVATRASRWVFR